MSKETSGKPVQDGIDWAVGIHSAGDHKPRTGSYADQFAPKDLKTQDEDEIAMSGEKITSPPVARR